MSRKHLCITCLAVAMVLCFFGAANAALTMKQIEQSMGLFRKSCSEKVGVDLELVKGLHRGEWPDDQKSLMCFTLCIAQSFGALTKKNELNETKMRKQIETQVPAHLKDFALGALEKCKDIQKDYKDACYKIYYSTKCMYYYSPENFIYP